MTLSSPHNPRIKRLTALMEKSRLRKETGVFVVEGLREVERCLAAGFRVEALFYCPEIASLPASLRECGADLYELPKDVYAKIAMREGTEGVVAEVRARSAELKDLALGESPLLVVLESVEKPGNLGAVLRSADAAGADALIICDPLTDLYNPNVIRASTGAIFSVPCVCCTSEEAIPFLRDRGIRILTAQLQDSSLYYDCDMRGATAIIMGTESTGLTQIWRNAADAHIRIPMLGTADSLNVSVSAAILLYEAVRQRNG